MRLCFLTVVLLLITTYCASQVRDVDSVIDLPRPVRSQPVGPSFGKDIEILSFKFLHPYLGYEGPNFTDLEGEPSAGVEYLAEVNLFGQEAVGTAKFEMIDEQGNVIQRLRFSKANTSLGDGDFSGVVKVPFNSFRIKVSGTIVDGAPYEHVYERLFRPTKSPPKSPSVPTRFSQAETKKIRASLIELQRQAIANTEKEAARHTDGLIVLPRARVSGVTYEPYFSAKLNALGIRLRYDIEYSVDGDYAQSLIVSPNYQDADLRGLVAMQIIKESIDPKPARPSQASPDDHVDLETLMSDGSTAWYRGGIVYHFVIDLVPDFVGQNATRTKFCVDETHYTNKGKSAQTWAQIMTSSKRVAYGVSIREVNYRGDTEPFMPPKSFYEGFLREGAVRCKPYKNIHF
jgi:hypothetical protein